MRPTLSNGVSFHHGRRNEKIAYKTINARVETVDTAPSYREAFKKRRGLIPVDGFYEWRKVLGGKIPYKYPDERRLPVRVRGLWKGGNRLKTEDQASNLQPCDPTIRLNGTIASQPVGRKLRRRSLGTSCLRRRRRQLLRLPPNLTLTRPSRKQNSKTSTTRRQRRSQPLG